MEEPRALTALAAMANPTRLRILRALVAAEPQGLTAGQLAETAEATPSRASFHLSNLADAGLVSSTRNAREITYRVEFAAIGGLIDYIIRDCCRNNQTVIACCAPSRNCGGNPDAARGVDPET